MSAKQDRLISQQQNYLDFCLAEEPYRRVTVSDKANARVDLAQLRNDLQTARAVIKEQEQDIANITAREAMIKQNYETAALNQAAELATARVAIEQAREVLEYITNSFYSHLHDEGQIVNEYDAPGTMGLYWDSIKQARAWLAAHAPDATPNHVHLADRPGGHCVICGAHAPQKNPQMIGAADYRAALEKIESIWVAESVTDEHLAALKMYTIAARTLNNADDAKDYAQAAQEQPQ